MKTRTALLAFMLSEVSCDSETIAPKSMEARIPTRSAEKSLLNAPSTLTTRENPEAGDSQNRNHEPRTNPIIKGTPFDESLTGTDRFRLLSECSSSNDELTIRTLVGHIDIPFIDPDKHTLSTVLTSPDWEVFPCMQILKKKGEAIFPFVIHELANPSPTKSIWYNEEGVKQRMLLRVLRSVVGRERAGDLVNRMEAGPGKISAITIWKVMNPSESRAN